MNQVLVVDFDGTLSDITHRVPLALKALAATDKQQSDVLWDIFHEAACSDRPIEPTIRLVAAMRRSGWSVVIMTGRPERSRGYSESWLFANGVDYNVMLMRSDGDSSHDAELKLDWARALKLDPATTVVLEDRDKVVKAWREAGYTCYQTAVGGY